MTDQTASATADTSEGGTQQTTESQTPDTSSVQQTAQTDAQVTDTKPEGDKPAEPQVPETYTFEMPEGIALDQAAQDEFSAVARELKLDQATAQKVADVGIKMAQRQQEIFETTKAAWVEQAKTDKEIGGDRFDQSLALAVKTLNAFGSPELKDVLNASGLGNHPAVIKLLVKAGKAISEDGFVTGAPRGADTDPAKKLYPNMN